MTERKINIEINRWKGEMFSLSQKIHRKQFSNEKNKKEVKIYNLTCIFTYMAYYFLSSLYVMSILIKIIYNINSHKNPVTQIVSFPSLFRSRIKYCTSLYSQEVVKPEFETKQNIPEIVNLTIVVYHLNLFLNALIEI